MRGSAREGHGESRRTAREGEREREREKEREERTLLGALHDDAQAAGVLKALNVLHDVGVAQPRKHLQNAGGQTTRQDSETDFHWG